MKDATAPTIDRVFLYGTLMSGHCRHHALQGFVRSIERSAWVRGHLIDLGDYPGLVAFETDRHSHAAEVPKVFGELIHVRDAASLLRRLDAIEGYDGDADTSLYLRRTVEVTTTDRRQTIAWTYFYNRPVETSGRWIESGRWTGK